MPENKSPKNTLDKEDIKSDFITIASHQLRTPIAGIRWSLDTLMNEKGGKLSDKQKEIVSEAYRNNNFLIKSVNDLLRATRLEERGINLVSKLVDVTKIVQAIIKQNRSFIKANNCKFTINLPQGLPKVFVDPLQIKPVIEALIDNAIKYSRGAGQIKIDLKKSGDKYLVMTVKDNGIGIPSDQKDQIFSRFFRARNAMKTQTEGLGLDLYIAKKIIDASGGKLTFTSIENRGSTFNLFLPLKSAVNLDQLKADNNKFLLDDKAEDILKKEREFVSITVHELKAPLGATKWSLEMLKGQKVGELNEQQLELINQVYRGNERLLVLVRDLLDLAKLQEGKFDVAPKPVKLETIIKDVIDGFSPEAKKKQIIITRPIIKSLPQVIGDPSRIAQVFTNILSNAIKYTPEKGKVIIEVKKFGPAELKKLGAKTDTADIQHHQAKKGYLVISIKDTGIGISKEEQKKLFSRFFRGKSVLKSKAEGTGLGLYITKTIVNLHGGDIWFTSQPGKGSTFFFSLPIA